MCPNISLSEIMQAHTDSQLSLGDQRFTKQKTPSTNQRFIHQYIKNTHVKNIQKNKNNIHVVMFQNIISHLLSSQLSAMFY
jgi:diaminopimelate epimerase